MRRLAIIAVLVAAGCSSQSSTPPGTQGPATIPGLKLEAPEANGFQLVMPVVEAIQPGESYEYCTWTDKVLDADIDVKAAKGFQSETGHHVILFYTKNRQPPGTTRVCTDDDMSTFRFALGTGGEGVANVLPGDLAMHIPKGSQLVANHHYLNASGKVMRAQSAINVKLADPGAKVTRSGAVAWLDSTIRVPQGRSSLDIKCTLQDDMHLWIIQPHMHRWGEHITVDHVTGDQSKRLFDLNWDPEYTFHPPEIKKDPSDPYVMKKGDQVNIKCDWNNTQGKDLTFGLEMCVTFGQTIDTAARGNIACDKGEWTDF